MLSQQNFRSLQNNNAKDVDVMKQITSFESVFLNWLVQMHNSLRKDQLNVDEIKHLSEILMHMKEEENHDYLESLIRPEISKGCKIPTTIPVPSSSFQLHNSITFAPNATGMAAIVFNPFFLSGNAGTNNSTMYINNNVGLTGNAVSNFFTAVDIGQTIPAVYNQYRLVSASIVVRYIGRLDIVQGVIGGAIVFDNAAGSNVVGTVNAGLQKYGNFNLAQDSFYYQENYTLNGIRELYFPLDTTFEQYRLSGPADNDPKTGFAYVVYIQDGVSQGASQNYKVDFYCNYECLPDATFLNYIPTTPGPATTAENKQHAVKFVQTTPITTAEIPRDKVQGTDFWSKIKSTLGTYLPKISDLVSLVPGVGKVAGNAIRAVGNYLGDTPSIFSGMSMP